jgi:hypothetical protein
VVFFFVKKYLVKPKCEGFGASAIFPGLVTPPGRLFPVSTTKKSDLKGQWFVNTEYVTAKTTGALTEMSKSCQECLHKPYERWQKYVIVQENYLEGYVV